MEDVVSARASDFGIFIGSKWHQSQFMPLFNYEVIKSFVGAGISTLYRQTNDCDQNKTQPEAKTTYYILWRIKCSRGEMKLDLFFDKFWLLTLSVAVYGIKINARVRTIDIF